MPDNRCELNNPELLQWAREWTNLTPQQLAGELMAALDEHYQACDILAAENGDRTLTEGELRAWAEACQVDLGVLCLPELPEEPTEAQRRAEIIAELEDAKYAHVIDGDLIDEAIEIIREVTDDE